MIEERKIEYKKSKTRVSFGVTSEDEPLDFVTELLDKEPTHLWHKGPHDTPRGVAHNPLHVWRLAFFDHDLPSVRIPEYLDRLLEFLEPRRDAVCTLLAKDNLAVEIRVWETQYSNVAGVRLDCATWRRLMEFCKVVQYQIVSLMEDDPE